MSFKEIWIDIVHEGKSMEEEKKDMGVEFSRAYGAVTDMVNDFLASLPNIFIGLIILLIFYFIGKYIRKLIRHFGDKRANRNLGIVLGRIAQWVTVLVGFLVMAVIIFPNFTPGKLVQLLGVGSIAIGFAFRDILQNFLAGILILLTNPFRIGDQIVVNNFEGTVEDIQTRATMIRTYDGRRVVIPNSDIFTDSVIVNTAFEKRRFQYDIGIGYGDNIKEAKKIILDSLHSIEHVLKDPAPDVLLWELGDFSVNLRARWWTEPPTRSEELDSRDEVLSAIKENLIAAGIDLPFPTRQILFHDQTEETDGDRTKQREGWPAGKGDTPKPRPLGSVLIDALKNQPRENGKTSEE